MKKSVPFLLGWQGEARVTNVIKNRLSDEWYLADDVEPENPKGTELRKPQIDHVLIGPKGVFTIETKNYVGKVYGNEDKLY